MKKVNLLWTFIFLLLLQSCSKKESSIIPRTTNLNSTKHTQWTLGDPLVNGVYEFKNPNSQCFQVGSAAQNAVVEQNTYIGYPNQQWDVTNLGWGVYTIINHLSGLALQVPGSSTAQNVQLTQGTYTAGTNQAWIITFLGWGQYKITNVGNGLAVTLDGNSSAQFAKITQTTFASDVSHDWSPTLISSLGTNTTYYVSQSSGSDSNNGTSSSTPWKTLAKANTHTFAAGEWLVLKSGDTWTGETLTLHGSGTALNPILLSSYGTGAKPAIKPSIIDEACVKLVGNAGWEISNLDLSKAKDGIRASYDQIYNSDYLRIENCTFHDLDSVYNSNPNLFNHFSNGVNIEGYAPYSPTARPVVLTNFTLQGCTFTNCSQALWAVGTIFSHCNSSGFTTGALVAMKNFTIKDCTATNGKQFGASFVSCSDGAITNFTTNHIGGGNNPYGTAAFVVTFSQNMTFDGCNMSYTYQGPNLSGGHRFDGGGFDFEGNLGPDGT